ncbi:MAG TPA: hypothetical protein PKM20_06325, partial [Nitrosomonas sp.]|nr:hypothetical protein [Nitrosomonas sp.]
MNRLVNQTSRHRAPGVYVESFVARQKKAEFKTGIPAFVGFGKLTAQALKFYEEPWSRITSWRQFEESVEQTPEKSFLRYAVRGFFENGGECCVIVPV